MRYTEKQIEELLKTARLAELNAPAEFWEASPTKLCKICNGIGAEAWPAKLRDNATYFFRSIQATAAIHDLEYQESDATESSRRKADRRFLANALAEIDYHYKWWNVKRYIAQRKAHIAYDALAYGGRCAWLEGFLLNDKPKGASRASH